PDRPLMISRVAGAQVAVVCRLIVGGPWRERAQTERGQEPFGGHIEHGYPFFLVEDRVLKREREQLVGAAGRVVSVLAINHVVEIAALRVPESLIERLAKFFGPLDERFRLWFVCAALFAHPFGQQPERVVPESVDLDGFAAARRDHPIADLGVHPGELVTRRALSQQAVARINADAEPRAPKVKADDVPQGVKDQPQSLAVAGRMEVTIERMKEP